MPRSLTEKIQAEQKMFGCTKTEINAAILEAAERGTGAVMVAMSILSDAQEELARFDPNWSATGLHAAQEKVRQKINRAKFIIREFTMSKLTAAERGLIENYLKATRELGGLHPHNAPANEQADILAWLLDPRRN
jgi:hypothetical protein